jgi:hypothetical protein
MRMLHFENLLWPYVVISEFICACNFIAFVFTSTCMDDVHMHFVCMMLSRVACVCVCMCVCVRE